MLQRLPGGKAPREAQAPGGGGGEVGREASGIRDPLGQSPPLFPSWELCRGRGLEGTRWGTQAPPLSSARGVAGGQRRGGGVEWRPAHPVLRRIPGLRAQIKGRGCSKLLLKCPLPTLEAPGWGKVHGPRLLE